MNLLRALAPALAIPLLAAASAFADTQVAGGRRIVEQGSPVVVRFTDQRGMGANLSERIRSHVVNRRGRRQRW